MVNHSTLISCTAVMPTLEIFLIIAAVCFCPRASKVEYEAQRVLFKSIQCNSSAKIVHQNMTCETRSFNRTFSTVTFIAYTKMQLYNVTVSIIDFQTEVKQLKLLSVLRIYALPVWVRLPRNNPHSSSRRLPDQ